MKTVFITGANRGIGFEIARQLGAIGTRVFLTARNEEKGKHAAEQLRAAGTDVEFIQLDVTSPESIIDAVRSFRSYSVNLDVLINNCGIMMDNRGDTQDSAEILRTTLETNTIGAYNVIRAFLPFIPDGGRIINLSSGLGQLHSMGNYAPAYSISKTALNAVTKQFASALRSKHIAVNSVCPGWVKTDMGGAGAEREVSKGAEIPVWLATDADIKIAGKFLRDKKEIPW
jgi:NAD(P)-dependent dehydrogenase (short-subunit alcohol dehydrogenase family)